MKSLFKRPWSTERERRQGSGAEREGSEVRTTSKNLKFGGYLYASIAVLNYALPEAHEVWTAAFIIIAYIHFVGAQILRELGH